jgi:hypothetical protein
MEGQHVSSRRVERHIIHGSDEAERKNRIGDILAASEGNVLHIFREIIAPGAGTSAPSTAR